MTEGFKFAENFFTTGMRSLLYIFFLLAPATGSSQLFDTAAYHITADLSTGRDNFFKTDPVWRGADGAASIDMGNGKLLWLFSDSFISPDSSSSRKKAPFVRNSIAIQNGYHLKTASVNYYWNRTGKKPVAFFHLPGKPWFWTGHGTMIKDKLLIFLLKEKAVKRGLSFEATGWYAVLISNPQDDPETWKMKYMKGPQTYGLIAGSAAVLKDDKYVYAYGAVEPSTHEVYVLRWELEKAYNGDISGPEWWMNGKWMQRKNKLPLPEPLFIGQTEFSIHYDSLLKKFLQFQSFGFGEAEIGLRMSDSIQGPWTMPYMICKPGYPGVKQPFMYTVKAHPELIADGIYLTYNVNSFDFTELVSNQSIYFPKFVRVKIIPKKQQ